VVPNRCALRWMFGCLRLLDGQLNQMGRKRMNPCSQERYACIVRSSLCDHVRYITTCPPGELSSQACPTLAPSHSLSSTDTGLESWPTVRDAVRHFCVRLHSSPEHPSSPTQSVPRVKTKEVHKLLQFSRFTCKHRFSPTAQGRNFQFMHGMVQVTRYSA
jgi:hypothetical protein